ncbi:hypothetical protein FACS1894166_06890 [Bacilli bacterium]|nr:hypothetical protein FACS1894166_06890 [Bacilli bacterium]
MTAISDIEVIHRQTESKMFYFKYLIEGSKDFITVATTRPETMFVDVAVFVNPKDKRYTKLVNKHVINPINGQKLKVLSDSYVDVKFGTGAMKCTPAHDFNDYQLALKHNLRNYETVMNHDGTLNDKSKTMSHSYQGQDRLKARLQIVEDIKEAGLLIKIEDHVSDIGYSERTGEVVEPLLSMQ